MLHVRDHKHTRAKHQKVKTHDSLFAVQFGLNVSLPILPTKSVHPHSF